MLEVSTSVHSFTDFLLLAVDHDNHTFTLLAFSCDHELLLLRRQERRHCSHRAHSLYRSQPLCCVLACTSIASGVGDPFSLTSLSLLTTLLRSCLLAIAFRAETTALTQLKVFTDHLAAFCLITIAFGAERSVLAHTTVLTTLLRSVLLELSLIAHHCCSGTSLRAQA